MPTLPFVGFGTLFDADNDGDADLFVANGHILANVGRWNDLITYAQMNQFFVNDDGRFRDASSWSGDGLLLARVSRGSAAVDIDEDGDLDLAVANNVGPATLLRNDLEGDHGWLQISLIGPAQGVGAHRRGGSHPDGDPSASTGAHQWRVSLQRRYPTAFRAWHHRDHR